MSEFDRFLQRKARTGQEIAPAGSNTGGGPLSTTGLPQPHAELQQSAGSVIGGMVQVDAEARSLVNDRRHSLLKSIFGDPAQRALVQARTKMIQTESEFRLRSLQAMREVQLKLLEDTLNGIRVKYAAWVRGDTAESLMREFNRVQAKFDHEFNIFYERVNEQLRYVDQLPHERLQEVEYARIDRMIKDFVAMSERLTENFSRIIQEHVTA
jgi:hypothetical protein